MWGRGRQRAGCSCQLQEQLHTSHMQPHTSCTPATFQLYTSHMPVTHQPHIHLTPAISNCTPASLLHKRERRSHALNPA